jgi:formylglycine-generating enzyme required for sulfatase activity
MKLGKLAWLVLFAILLGMAACGEDAALPTETATMAEIATPPEPASETGAAPTATSSPTQSAPTTTPAHEAEATAPPTATVSPTTEPTRTSDVDAGLAQIAFTSGRDGNLEIYIMNADGSDPQRLTDQPGEDYWPTWSPDGRKIAFASERDGNLEIYVMNADGSDQQRLTNNTADDLEPAWSPDGAQIAFMVHSAARSAIYVMDADGSNRRSLTDSDGNDWLPAWSPDGTQLAFVSQRDGNPEIYVMAADGSNQRRLTDNAGEDTYPAWSPEGALGGQQISFFSVRDGNRDLYVMAIDGTNVRRLTHDDASVWVSAWSPDGTQLAFTSARDGNREIYVMDADGTNLWRLTNNRVLDGIPAWRPTASSTPPSQPDLGDTWARPVDGMTMVYVPGGEFQMGSAHDDSAAVSDEQPQHSVRLDGFWIDQTEVTNAQFVQFLNQQGNSDAQGATMIILDQGYTQIFQVGDQFTTKDAALHRPVVMVTWYGAAAYCDWAGGRLPTEAEWEYAARGPGGNLYPWGDAAPSCDLATYGTCVGVPVDVGSHPAGASWCGALDMAGNVWEWIVDWFGPYSGLPQENPTGPASGDVPVLRGGGWHSPPWEIRSAFRQHELSRIEFNG